MIFPSRNFDELKELDRQFKHRSPILLRAYLEYRMAECPDLSYLDTMVIDDKVRSQKYTQQEYEENGIQWLCERNA